jgi:hypothetical protein
MNHAEQRLKAFHAKQGHDARTEDTRHPALLYRWCMSLRRRRNGYRLQRQGRHASMFGNVHALRRLASELHALVVASTEGQHRSERRRLRSRRVAATRSSRMHPRMRAATSAMTQCPECLTGHAPACSMPPVLIPGSFPSGGRTASPVRRIDDGWGWARAHAAAPDAVESDIPCCLQTHNRGSVCPGSP